MGQFETLSLFPWKEGTPHFLREQAAATPSVKSSFGGRICDRFASEWVGVSLCNVAFYHQREWRNLSVFFEYESFDESPSASEVKRFTWRFLEGYAEQDDFWEEMNRNFVFALLKKFPQIGKLNSRLELAPDRALFCPRRSVVTYQSGKLTEEFGFTTSDWPCMHEMVQALDLDVFFLLKNNLRTGELPDYLWVEEAMGKFFKVHPLTSSTWATLKSELERFLLSRFPAMRKVCITSKIH